MDNVTPSVFGRHYYVTLSIPDDDEIKSKR